MSQIFTYGVPVIIFYFGGKANFGTFYKYISCLYIYIYIYVCIYIPYALDVYCYIYFVLFTRSFYKKAFFCLGLNVFNKTLEIRLRFS